MLFVLFSLLKLQDASGFECEYTEPTDISERAGSFTADLWHWPDHIVYYRFSNAVIKEDRKIIREAMEEIEDNTCMTFQETNRRQFKILRIHTLKTHNCVYCYWFGLLCPHRNGGTVRTSPFCTGNFECPYYFGSVEMNLQFNFPFCGRLSTRWKGLIIHELLHSLGLIHTQARPDRNKYIKIHRDAIKKSSMDQYMPICHSCATYNIPYECHSIMHYGYMDFAAIGRLLAFFKPTMSSRHPSCRLTADGGHTATQSDWDMANRAQRCGRYNTP